MEHESSGSILDLENDTLTAEKTKDKASYANNQNATRNANSTTEFEVIKHENITEHEYHEVEVKKTLYFSHKHQPLGYCLPLFLFFARKLMRLKLGPKWSNGMKMSKAMRPL